MNEIFDDILSFINQKDFFWLRQLREHLGVQNADPKHIENSRITNVITGLKRSGAIQCTEVRGCERQYMRVRVCAYEDIKRGKNK